MLLKAVNGNTWLMEAFDKRSERAIVKAVIILKTTSCY
jgi:hypothetical protein